MYETRYSLHVTTDAVTSRQLVKRAPDAKDRTQAARKIRTIKSGLWLHQAGIRAHNNIEMLTPAKNTSGSITKSNA